MRSLDGAEVSAKTVTSEWFKGKVLIEFRGWTARFPVAGTVDSERKKFPALKFKYYQLQDGPREQQGTWAVANDVLILQRETPGAAKLVIYHDPPKTKPV